MSSNLLWSTKSKTWLTLMIQLLFLFLRFMSLFLVPELQPKEKEQLFRFRNNNPRVRNHLSPVVSRMIKSPEQIIDARHDKSTTQTTIEYWMRTTVEKERAHMYIAKFFYENGLSFNVANSRSYELMLEAVGHYGPDLKLPTFFLSWGFLFLQSLSLPRTPRNRLEKIWMLSYVRWFLCPMVLMSDSWTDRRQRHHMNFLANRPEGTFFMGSVDASDKVQDAPMHVDLLDIYIKKDRHWARRSGTLS